MPRGYWLLVVTLGLILASPSHSQEAKRDQAKASQNPAAQLKRIATPIEKQPIAATPDRGCQPGQDDRQSDLCAQWKAADAATESARWSLWLLWVSGLGLLVGGGTLFAAWRAAHWAKKAAEHTETGAKAALDAQRPWVSVAFEFTEFEIRDELVRVSFAARFTNIGKTVAQDLNVRAVVKFVGSDYRADAETVFNNWERNELGGPFNLMPGEATENWGATHIRYETMPWFEGHETEQVYMLAIARVRYRIPGDVPGSPFRQTDRTFSVAAVDPDLIKRLTIKKSNIWSIKPQDLIARATVPRRTT